MSRSSSFLRCFFCAPLFRFGRLGRILGCVFLFRGNRKLRAFFRKQVINWRVKKKKKGGGQWNAHRKLKYMTNWGPIVPFHRTNSFSSMGSFTRKTLENWGLGGWRRAKKRVLFGAFFKSMSWPLCSVNGLGLVLYSIRPSPLTLHKSHFFSKSQKLLLAAERSTCRDVMTSRKRVKRGPVIDADFTKMGPTSHPYSTCMYIYISLSLYVSLSFSLSLSLYLAFSFSF